ncbi:MAG: orotidine 5'-phosphate decarboxylase [Aigarchaeota archaeon]|nr:orotidine 5'-phosphate decarboxylase [Candidatus Wolframiiraptor gerlachensis]
MAQVPRGRAPEKLWRISEDRRSRLIIALDLHDNSAGKQQLIKRYTGLLDGLREFVVGVKIGLPLSLSIGFDGISEILDRFKGEFYMIADFKLSDIPEIIQVVLEGFWRMGFDAAIAHLFQGGVGEVRRSIDLFGVVAMSHPQAQLIQQSFHRLLEEAKAADVNGIIVGATRGQLIAEARRILPETTILSPGIVAQGASPAHALRMGGDFEIVGRAITMAEKPLEAARIIVEAERDVLYA